jgi:hypothetical protein
LADAALAKARRKLTPLLFVLYLGSAIALVNPVGNLGGFAGLYLVGMVKQVTHSFAGGMMLITASLVAGATLALTLPAPLRDTEAS